MYPQVSDMGAWGATEPEEEDPRERKRQRRMNDRELALEYERLDEEIC